MRLASHKLHLVAALLSLAFVSVVVVRSSSAAFSDATDNPGNTFTTGDVVLADDDGGASSMFSVSGMKPGVAAIRCINVTYSGSLSSQVRMYGAVTAGTGLEDYLDVTIERSTGATGGPAASCANWVDAGKTTVWSTAADGDLGVLLGSATDYASGEDAWAVTGGAPDDTASYRITVTLQDDNAAQTLGATVTFTWEAQSV